SGSVRFTRSGSSAGFDFADGELAAAFSSDARFETGAILVRAGKLDGAALEKLAVPPGTDGALAALQAGILTRREWKWGEKIRAIEILAELLGWPDGKYLFDADARPSRSDFSLAIPRLLLELFLRSRDRHLVDHQLGSTELPLRRSPNFDTEFATFGLTADAESVVHLIDGQATATEICDRAPAEEFAVLKLLAALKTLGLLVDEEVAPPAPAAEPPLPPLAELPVALPEPIPAAEGEEPVLEEEREEGREDEFALPELDDSISRAAAGEPFPAPESPSSGLPPPLERETPEPALDAEVGEAAPRWEGESVEKEWQTPSDDLDRELDTTVEPQSSGGPPRSKSLLWILLAILAAAVGTTVLVRSRGASRETQTTAMAPTPRRIRPSPAVSPTAAPAALVASPLPSASPVPSPTRAPSRAPTPRPGKATPAPAAPAPAGRSEGSREEWLARARNDKRKLDADRKTRYSIQLELACEVPSLVEAWKHDRPAGSMWLLAVSRGGRDCFRVLWGRFPSIEAAKKAKTGAPAFFTTATNHPAVVAVR
ncbi:MAG TPA: hypothetical protein VJA66_15910, partial [Thermoanaerobaculia bacterium]